MCLGEFGPRGGLAAGQLGKVVVDRPTDILMLRCDLRIGRKYLSGSGQTRGGRQADLPLCPESHMIGLPIPAMVKSTCNAADTGDGGEHTLNLHLKIRQRVTQRRCHALGDNHIPAMPNSTFSIIPISTIDKGTVAAAPQGSCWRGERYAVTTDMTDSRVWRFKYRFVRSRPASLGYRRGSDNILFGEGCARLLHHS